MPLFICLLHERAFHGGGKSARIDEATVFGHAACITELHFWDDGNDEQDVAFAGASLKMKAHLDDTGAVPGVAFEAQHGADELVSDGVRDLIAFEIEFLTGH